MKVLFVAHWFPSDDYPHKGIFIKEQAKALLSVGVDVEVLHFNIGPGPKVFHSSHEELNSEGLRIFRINLIGKFWKFIYTIYPIQLWLIRRELKHLNIDYSSFYLVHSHIIHPAGAMGHILAKEHDLPHYIGEQWSNVNHYFSKFVFNSWGKRAYNEAVKIFVLSKFLRETVALHVRDQQKLMVVPNVVAAEDFYYEEPAKQANYYVVIAASWNKGKRLIKRPKLLIEAVAEAGKQLNRPITMGIIGNGDRIPELKEFAKEQGIDAVFHGFMNKKQLSAEFRKADIFMHGSEYETFSVVIAEALKCGTPVVGSNVAAIPELISEDCGILVKNDLASWTSAIVQALNAEFNRSAIANKFKNRFGNAEVGNMLKQAYIDSL